MVFVTIQNHIRKIAVSQLSFCSCLVLTKEIFKNKLKNASIYAYFIKIALVLNSYKYKGCDPILQEGCDPRAR